jgi:hypothetical protein
MATVGKELPTHLNAWKAIFFGLLTGIIPSQEVEAPCALGRAFIIDEAQDITRVCSPHIEMSPSAEAGEPLQGIHLSFILSIFLVVFRWL